MTVAQDRSAGVHNHEGVGAVLRATHNIWIQETDTYLTPVIRPGASFWERWTAVRYLAGDFVAQYRRECALLEELRKLLPAAITETLLHEAERIEQLRQELDRIGRRRGTAQTVSVAARLLLDSLRHWCADIEAAAWEIDNSEVPDEVRRVLAGFECYAQVHA
jgi:hypothetical protein